MSFRPLTYFAATVTLATSAAAPALATPNDFLNTLGGSSNVKTVGANTPQAVPLTRDRQWLVGARFFSEKCQSALNIDPLIGA